MNSLGEISAKRWPKTVKLGSTLAATFLSISDENYANKWFKSNATGISVMYTDAAQ